MATHVFEAKDGTRVERWYSMHKNAPKKIKIGGKWFHRQFGTGAFVSVEGDYVCTGYQFDENDAKFAKRVDADGFPVCTSKEEIRDLQGKVNDASKGTARFEYDFGLHNRT